MPWTDHQLVSRALSAPPGDHRAFEELVGRHQGHIRADCSFIVPDWEMAQDLAQEVFVKAYFALNSFQGRASFKTWLRRIKVNRCLEWRRRQKPVGTVDIEDSLLSADPAMRTAPRAEENLEREDTRRRVTETLDRIPDTLRIALILRDMDGLTYEEIAGTLGIGLSASKMRVARGREAFREVWNRDEASAA